MHNLTLVSNESATTNYTRVYVSGAPGSSYVTSKSFFPLLIAVVIPLLILLLAAHEIRWKVLQQVAQEDPITRKIRER